MLGGAPPRPGCSAMAMGDAAPYGGTFFFFRSEMDPLNTLWLAPVGSAIVGAPLFYTHRGSRREVMATRRARLI